jgi:YHS domain-containing protein
MKTLQKATFFIAIILLLSSCSSSKGIFASKKAKDPVCGMRVVKANAISYEYEDNKYYFDTDKCKQIFIMSPRKFVGQ